MLNEVGFANPETVTAVKLVDSGGPALLVSTLHGMGTTLFLRPLAGAEDSPRELMPLATPDRPAWDAQPLPDGAVLAAYTVPGSSLCSIAMVASGHPERANVTGHYPFGVFGPPRFVKGEAGHRPSIVTIAIDDEGESKAVLFAPRQDGGYGEYRVLDTGTAVPQQPMMLQAPSGYVLLYKQYTPGSGAPERVDAIDSTITPGPLFCRRLDANLRSTEPASQILPGPVYQFDAVLDAGRLLVLATTQKGYLLAIGGFDGKQTGLAVSERAWPEPLFSPSLLMGHAGLHLAALQAAGTSRAKILVGKH
jgi:hypothetical protein